MTETRNRRLPVGIQSFEEIREGGYLYVDKTDIVWQLANRGKKYNYLSRPRRFGKSVLVDTLEAYFLGKRELFEGLRIMELEREWVKRPVIRLDMSQAGAEPESVRSYLDNAFHNLETEYGIVVRQESSLAVRFMNIIEGAYNKTGQQVAILIDEYDSPMQHSWGDAPPRGLHQHLQRGLRHPEGRRQIREVCLHHGHHQVYADLPLLRAQQSEQHQF